MQEEYIGFQTNIDEILEKKKLAAKAGGEVWNQIQSKLEDRSNYVLLFPDDEKEILKYGMLYMDSFATRNSIKGICVCTNSDFVISNVDQYASSVCQIIKLETVEVENLIQLYAYYPFYKNFEIVSYSKPHCRDASQMLTKNGLTKEQLIAIGVYKIIPFERI